MPAPVKLIMANKAYSSWSVRPWLVLAHFKIPFEEIVIPMNHPGTRKAMLKHSPTGKCPALRDGDLLIWDSLAIIEYLAEKYPEKAIWPKTRAARAHARSACAEMHSGFQALRKECPMNLRREKRAIALSEEALADAKRIDALWNEARKTFGKAGPFLYGKFSAADAFFAPVVNRLSAYDVKVSKGARDYMKAVQALPAWQALVHDAEQEVWHIERTDSL